MVHQALVRAKGWLRQGCRQGCPRPRHLRHLQAPRELRCRAGFPPQARRRRLLPLHGSLAQHQGSDGLFRLCRQPQEAAVRRAPPAHRAAHEPARRPPRDSDPRGGGQERGTGLRSPLAPQRPQRHRALQGSHRRPLVQPHANEALPGHPRRRRRPAQGCPVPRRQVWRVRRRGGHHEGARAPPRRQRRRLARR